MTDLRTLFEEYENYRTGHAFTGNPKTLYAAMQYIMDLGGKRARPMLTLAGAISAGGSIQNALPVAHAAEVFHNFSLVHDDIMDNAGTRRGKPTVHMQWNEPTAILAGDNMLAACFGILSSQQFQGSAAVMQLFVKTATEVCEGQQMDMDFAETAMVSEADYLEMIRLKTAVLLGCCAAGGAITAGTDSQTATMYYDFAIALGMAFQLTDDYLDTFGSEEKTGKKQGGDIAEGKKTWLYIKSAENGPEISDIYKLKDTDQRIVQATELFKKQQLDVQLQTLAGVYHQKADEILAQLAAKGHQTQVLSVLAEYLESRQH